MKSFSFPSDIPIRPDTVRRSPCAIYRIRTRRPPRPLEVSMPRSLNLPQAILAIALHAAGRPLLTQELAVLAGKPQEAIASLLEPLLGAGFVAHTEAPGAWVCPGPAGCRAGRIRAPSRPERPSGQPHPCPRAARGSGHGPRRLHRHRRGHRRRSRQAAAGQHHLHGMRAAFPGSPGASATCTPPEARKAACTADSP